MTEILSELLTFGVSSRSTSVLLEINLKKLPPHGLNLFLRHRTHVESPHNSPHVLRGLDGSKARDAGSQDEDFGGGDFAGCSHLTCEETTKFIGSFEDGTVTGYVGLGREGVEGLGVEGGGWGG